MDYLVVEGMLESAEETVTDNIVEKRGLGVNKYVYWVTDCILEDWVQLPDAKPEHIAASRKIKHVFTGKLNSQIDSNPQFPGRERHFLRAQIARIVHATTIIPKGLYEIDEETQEMKMAEEFGMPATDELKSLETWAHMHGIILSAGRLTHPVATHLPEEERDEYMEKLNTEDPSVDRFRALNEDAPIPGLEVAWLTKLAGDTQPYNKLSGEGTTSYAVNVLKSLRWPGSVTVS